ILFQADGYGYVSESNESNNVAYKAINIIDPKPDLIVQNQSTPSLAKAGDTIKLTSYVKNIGDATAGYSYLKYYLSDDINLDSGDKFLGNDYVGSLAAGSSSYKDLTFTLDSGLSGTKYILFQADGYNYVLEGNELNNVAYAAINITSGQDWFDLNIKDSGLRSLARSKFTDSKLDRNDMISLFKEGTQDGNTVDATELTDLRTLVNNYSYLNIDDHVRILSNKVANSDPANQWYTGGNSSRVSLGNLYAGSTSTHLNTLVDKWFLGKDRPTLTDSSYDYRLASGSLFQNGISYTDVNQGSVGDCYYLAGLANTALHSSSTIQSMFIDNGDETFTVRFYNNGVADYVTVDKYLPVHINSIDPWQSGGFIYAGQSNPFTTKTTVGNITYTKTFSKGHYSNVQNELWVMLAEKAYAQINESGWLQGPTNSSDKADRDQNSYAGIGWGYGDGAIEDITGFNTTYDNLTISDASNILDAFNSDRMVYLSSKSSPVNSNVVNNHGYVLVGYNSSIQKFKIYNPWGLNSSNSKPGHLELSISELVQNFNQWTWTTS
ncbi:MULTISPECIES: CARDB domain-containing protein, partial [Spirulina sp. CCY15215]|uniref:CARDB domain-containing protein n=1 Tax=Spirulina sp. CCY15215 TaxID=2767591 RepID=UPI0019529ABF